jgi:hypothetical protein
VKDAKWWAVRDPAAIGHRVALANDLPTLIYVLAKKNASTVPLRKTPQQSDYVTAWTSSSRAGRGLPPETAMRLESVLRLAAKNVFPPIVRRLLSSPFKSKFFEEVDLWKKL